MAGFKKESISADSTTTLTNKTIDGDDNTLQDIAVSSLKDGTDGELITWGADGAATTVAAGTSGQVLTSNGAGAAPTFQDASSGSTRIQSLQEPIPFSAFTTSTPTILQVDGLSTTAYTIANGKTLIVTSIYVDGTSEEVKFNGLDIAGSYTNQVSSTVAFGGMTNNIFLVGNGTKTLTSDSDKSTVFGILVDTADLGTLTPVQESIVQGSSTYTVPANKIFVLTHVYKGSTSILYSTSDYMLSGEYGIAGRFLNNPIVIPAGKQINFTAGGATGVIYGYLVADDWTY